MTHYWRNVIDHYCFPVSHFDSLRRDLRIQQSLYLIVSNRLERLCELEVFDEHLLLDLLHHALLFLLLQALGWWKNRSTVRAPYWRANVNRCLLYGSKYLWSLSSSRVLIDDLDSRVFVMRSSHRRRLLSTRALPNSEGCLRSFHFISNDDPPK